MEQQQFRISLSVGTKLLIGVAVFLSLLIAFLSASAIFILNNDKQAYTFETKSIEASLSGRQLTTMVQHVLDTLRMSMGMTDPAHNISAQETEAIRFALNNQSEIALMVMTFLDVDQATWKSLTSAVNPSVLEGTGLNPDQLSPLGQLTPEWTRTILPDIVKSGYGFINLSTQGVPLLGVVLADRSFRAPSSGGTASIIPAAIAVVPLRSFGSELGGLDLTVATRSGWVLYDTNPSILFSRRNIEDDPMIQNALVNTFTTGTKSYAQNGERFLGGFSKPGFDLVVITRAEWYQAMRATYALTEKFILLGCMATGAGIVAVILFSKSILAPVKTLYLAAQQVSSGDFNLALEPRTRDELGALTHSFNTMSAKIKELFAESIEKTILEKELDIASTVQQRLIPPESYRDRQIEFFSHYQAASRCGGDWWGLFRVGNKFVMGIADATGHGFTSALITASARSCFSMLHQMALDNPNFSFSPSEMLSYANRVIFEAAQGNIMMTVFIGVIDFSTHKMTYANAAHNPPWLFTRSGGRYKLNSMVSGGTRLGEKAEIPPIAEGTFDAHAGDILFMYTDGLVEGRDKTDEMFGKKRTRKAVEERLAQGPEAIVNQLLNDFMNFKKPGDLDDDITIAVARLLG